MLPKAALSSSSRSVMQKKTVFFGEDDGALYLPGVEKTRNAFTGPCETVRMKDAGHFLHLEQQSAFHERLLAFIAKARTSHHVSVDDT